MSLPLIKTRHENKNDNNNDQEDMSCLFLAGEECDFSADPPLGRNGLTDGDFFFTHKVCKIFRLFHKIEVSSFKI